MRKQITIVALLVFFLAQFGKVINFCFCKVAAYEQASSFICDCEKQLYTLINTDKSSKEQSPQHISSQLPSEELFHFSDALFFITNHTPFFIAWPKSSSESLYCIFGKNIFRPPLQIS